MIPESDWTDSQRRFIGAIFSTPKGGVLTVTGVSEKKSGTNSVFILECSICSLDTVLWPYGRILSIKSGLVRGQYPCGCSRNPIWTPKQDLIHTNRILAEKLHNLKAVGTIEEKGRDRKFILECNVCSQDIELWPRGSILSVKSSLVNGQLPCGCARNPKWSKLQYEVLINRKCAERGYDFLGFVGEYKGVYTYLKLHNPANDNTWCTTTVTNFLSGGNGCPLEGNVNIANKLRTPQSEREQQIADILKLEGGSFVSWHGEYKNVYSKFKWTCNEGHRCCTNVNDFINCSNRCMTCHKIKQRENGVGYGYYPDKINEADYLYIIHFKKDGCIKVGRSFDVNRRVKELLRLSNNTLAEIEILAVFTDTHQEIYNTEQWIHEELTERGFHEPMDWTTETFTVDCQNALFYLLNKTKLTKLVDIVE